MHRVIITGTNGTGKSHFAAQLAALRPDVPVISFDTLKLKTRWQQRPGPETDAALARTAALIWLDPPGYIRAWRLARRPWKQIGRTRPELPAGNTDWPWPQYRFALRSLKNGSHARALIQEIFAHPPPPENWPCRNQQHRTAFLRQWTTHTRP